MNNLIKDEFLLEQTNTFTRKMLALNMDINKICMFVKDYTYKYNFIKEQSGEKNASTFTMDVWWQLGQRGGNKFSLANLAEERLSILMH